MYAITRSNAISPIKEGLRPNRERLLRKLRYREEVDIALKKRARVLAGYRESSHKRNSRKRDRSPRRDKTPDRRGNGDSTISENRCPMNERTSWLTRRRVVAIGRADDKIGGERREVGSFSQDGAWVNSTSILAATASPGVNRVKFSRLNSGLEIWRPIVSTE